MIHQKAAESTVTLAPLSGEECALIVKWNADTDADFLHQWSGATVYRWPIDVAQIQARFCSERRRIYAIRSGGDTVGSVELDDIYGGSAVVARFIVDPQRRGDGVGKAALSALCRKAKDLLGLNSLSLRVYLWNEPARHCYESCGFSVCGVNDPDDAKWASYTMQRLL